MVDKYKKLELTWIGKDVQPKLEPRILLENPDKSYGSRYTQNMLIHGDNLLALKALENDFAGKIKCIYIDPPYNTGYAFQSYDDGIEHSIWLSLMRDRLAILRQLLADNGVIFIQIDDREQAYLKVICDEIFGRDNFVCTFIWEARSGQGNTVRHIAELHEYVLCFAKNATLLNLKKRENVTKKGNYFDEKGSYSREQLRQWGQGDRREDRPSMYFPIHAPDGTQVWPLRPDGSDGRWRCGVAKVNELLVAGDIDFVRDEGGQMNCYKKIRDGKISYSAFGSLLLGLGTASTGTREIKEIFGQKIFDTPKPENLVRHLVDLATDPGDFVLDSFAGSGTTGAVAHKMNRRWIVVELSDACSSVILPRLKKICDGKDLAGITAEVNWKGGGGFKYYELAPSLLEKDNFDMWVINQQYNAAMLAAAMAKHENFKYCPDATHYWKQGRSSEKDYIFTTTTHLTRQKLDRIHQDMRPDESLLICCKSHFEKAGNQYKNITVKKIPAMLLGRCEFGKEDYSLNIVDMPRDRDEPEFKPVGPNEDKVRKSIANRDQLNIFTGLED